MANDKVGYGFETTKDDTTIQKVARFYGFGLLVDAAQKRKRDAATTEAAKQAASRPKATDPLANVKPIEKTPEQVYPELFGKANRPVPGAKP